jgi:transcriptional antiterminator RfaH
MIKGRDSSPGAVIPPVEGGRRSWFLLNTKPQKEFRVERLFTEASFEVYLPKLKKGTSLKPFFPCYEFIRFDYPGDYNLVKYTRGVKAVVRNETGPIPVPDQVIDEIRSREVDGLVVIPHGAGTPREGDEIEVTEGPLKGLHGIFKQELSGRERVLILLNYVCYQGRLLIEKDKVHKAG